MEQSEQRKPLSL